MLLEVANAAARNAVDREDGKEGEDYYPNYNNYYY